MYNPSAKTGIEPTFYGKVMSFFALALFASAAGTFVGVQYLEQVFFNNPFLIWIVLGVELVLIFTSSKWSTKAPLNRLLFAGFAFLSGLSITPLMVMLMATAAGAAMVMKALAITGVLFTAMALLGWTTNINLSGMRGFLMASLIGLILVQVVGFFIPWSNTTEIVVSSFGTVLFSGFVAYDMQKIKKFPEDRYIDAALHLYLDIFNLFLYVLRLLMALNNRN